MHYKLLSAGIAAGVVYWYLTSNPNLTTIPGLLQAYNLGFNFKATGSVSVS